MIFVSGNQHILAIFSFEPVKNTISRLFPSKSFIETAHEPFHHPAYLQSLNKLNIIGGYPKTVK